MTILFGTIEYFERELLNELNKNNKIQISKDHNISFIYSKLKGEAIYDLVCDETVREKCLKNLKRAYKKIKVRL